MARPGLDIFERLYAVRLDRLRAMPQAHELLAGLTHGLLAEPKLEPLDDQTLLAELAVGSSGEDDISVIKHVRSREERQAAEEVANRTVCQDFERFKPLFEQAETISRPGFVRHGHSVGMQVSRRAFFRSRWPARLCG
ncbi:MAG: hypothetical protein WKF37_21010 [Bryobacteraceae bacterium]